jgi:hypothetical protein
LPRLTGDGPVPAPPFSRRCDWRPSPLSTSRSGSPRSAWRAVSGAPDRTRPPRSSGAAGASRSSPSRSRALEAGLPIRSRCAARTGCPASTAGPGLAEALEPSAATAAAAVRSASTTRRRRSTPCSRRPNEADLHLATLINIDSADRVRSFYVGAIFMELSVTPENITYSASLHNLGSPKGPAIDEFIAEVDNWFDRLRTWIEVFTGQDADPTSHSPLFLSLAGASRSWHETRQERCPFRLPVA